MHRQFYLELAAAGLRMPIGTHLVLHDKTDPEAIKLDGERLGEVVAETALRFRTPLAVPLMDLTLEKTALLAAHGISESEAESFHFERPPSELGEIPLTRRMAAMCEALRYIARQTKLFPVGMCIGPFSLTTKLMADPIAPVFMAGASPAGRDEPEVQLLEGILASASTVILRYLEAQIEAGAKAVIICEPAANKVYFSPNQLARGYETFDRLVMEPNRRIRQLLAERNVDLIFHNCGELLDNMVRRFASLAPAILSLGSSRRLWEDAALVPKSIVLYGNLPTKRFYADSLISCDEVKRLAAEITRRMAAINHPFILGSECDVLSVPGCERVILEKVEAFLAIS